TLLVALGALAVYWLAKRIIKNELIALVFLSAYLLHPALQNANLFAVHGITFAAPFLLFTFYFFHIDRYGWGLFFAILSLLCREDIAIILFMFGIYFIFSKKKRALGIGVSMVSVLWFLLFFARNLLGISNWFDSSSHQIVTQYGILAEPIIQGEAAKPLSQALLEKLSFLRPDLLISRQNVWLIIKLFLPVLFLSFLSPSICMIGAPTLAIYLLSRWPEAHGIDHHYAAPLMPIIFYSAINGLSNLRAKLEKESFVHRLPELLRGRLVQFAVPGVLLLSLLSCSLWSNVFYKKPGFSENRIKAIEEALTLIPESASVTADRFLGTRITHRLYLYHFPTNKHIADYVLYDLYSHSIRIQSFDNDGRMSFPWIRPANAEIMNLLQDKKFGVEFFKDGILLLKRGADHNAGLKNLALEKAVHKSASMAILPQANYVGSIIRPRSGYWQNDLHINLFWECTGKAEKDFAFRLKFEHTKTGNAYFVEHKPVFGLYPTSVWNAGEVVRDQIFIGLDEPWPQGEYNCYVQPVALTNTEPAIEENFTRLFSFVY
ncbi:MAG: DUF2079 domain-containing protein, partial [bacterium]